MSQVQESPIGQTKSVAESPEKSEFELAAGLVSRLCADDASIPAVLEL
jgi:hypothetical protein